MSKRRKPVWTIGMLDRFRLERDGEVVALLADRRPEQLLAYLALRSGHLVEREEIAVTFWPDKETYKARMLLSEVLFRLRAQLEDAGVEEDLVITTKRSMGLQPTVRTDVVSFQDQADALEGAADAETRERLLALYGEGLLPGWDEEDWIQTEREALAEVAAALRATPVLAGGAPAGTPVTSPPDDTGAAAAPAHGTQPLELPLSPASFTEHRRTLRAMREAHLEACCALVEAVEPQLRGPERARWMQRLDTMSDEIADALDWAMEQGQWRSAYRMAGALWRWWARRDASAGAAVYDRLLAEGQVATPALKAQVQHAAGALALSRRDLAAARRHLQGSLEIQDTLGDSLERARDLMCLGIVEYNLENDDKARSYYDVALGIVRARGERVLELGILKNASLLELRAERREAAREHLARRLELAEDLGDLSAQANALADSATLASQEESWEEAERLVREAQSRFQEAGDDSQAPFLSLILGYVCEKLGRLEDADDAYRRSLALAEGRSDSRGIGEALRYLGELARTRGDEDAARDYLAKSERVLAAAQDPRGARLAAESRLPTR